MQREILFRGKEGENCVWLYGDLIHGLNGIVYIRHIVEREKDKEARTSKVIPETVGQFTGLTDKYGVRIFDGDVIQWLGFEVREGKQIRPYRSYILDSFDVLFKIRNIVMENGTAEVIGNIHDNKELLK